MRILQARILEWVAIPFSRDLPNPGIEPTSFLSPALAGRFLSLVPLGSPQGSRHGLKKKVLKYLRQEKYHLKRFKAL